MKILLVNKYFFIKGGAENSFFQTAKILEKKGHEVSFFSMRHSRNMPSKYDKYFVSNVDYEKNGLRNAVRVSHKLLYSFEAKKNIVKLIKDEKPDIVHLNNIYHQLSPSILHAIKQFDLPVVMSLRDYKMVCASYLRLSKGKVCNACRNGKYYHCYLASCVKNSRLKSLLSMVEMYLHHKILRIYDLVDVFISPSQSLKSNLVEIGFKGNVVYLPNFVNTNNFVPKFNYKQKTIVYFGRLSREKGLETLIDAIKDIKDVHLKIVGEGPLRNDLEKRAQNGNNRNIRFLGYKTGEQLKHEIRESMFTVLPSECCENNPRSIIEAFALGKSTLASRIGGIPELVKDGETGITFEPGNLGDLTEKLIAMLKNPDKVSQMGKSARKMIKKKYNAESHYDNLMKIYKSVMI
jgi:glycosyltransferase involved in cell wall biosynthesis